MAAECKEWKKAFIADGENQGVPVEVITSACNEKGNRQSWCYDVTFAGGEQKLFNLPCISLPVNINRLTLEQRLKNVPMQQFHESFYQTRDKVFENIKKLLHHRMMDDKIEEWRELFYEIFPKNKEEEESNRQCSSLLLKLAKTFHGPIRVATQETEPVGKSYFVDEIVFKGIAKLVICNCVSI